MTQNMKGEEEKTELGISQSQVRATIFYLGQGHHLPFGYGASHQGRARHGKKKL